MKLKPLRLGSFSFLGLAAISLIVFIVVIAYVFIGGSILGQNVSSLDSNGPQWPFTVAYYSIFAAIVLGVIGAILLVTSLVGEARKTTQEMA